MKKITEICGEVLNINYDDKIKIINAELAQDSIGTNLIILQDWTKKSKNIITLHIKEAIELKGVIDRLIYDSFDLKGEIENDLS